MSAQEHDSVMETLDEKEEEARQLELRLLRLEREAELFRQAERTRRQGATRGDEE